MSKFISIADFLRTVSSTENELSTSTTAATLISDLLTRLELQVLSGKAFEDLRRDLNSLRNDLPQSLENREFIKLQGRFGEIVSGYQIQLSALSLASALEMQKVVAMLNQTLQLLAAGSERSVSRLREVEVLLARVSRLDDIVALKSHLSDCLTFVRRETARAQEEDTQMLASLKEEFRKAQEALLFCGQDIPSRKAAEQSLAHLTSSGNPHSDWFVAVFVLKHFDVVARRYGPSLADQLMLELIRSRIQPNLEEGSSIFRWSKDSILTVIPNGSLEELQDVIRNSICEPLDYKAPVGNRMAVLTITNRWIAWAGADLQYRELVDKIDAFTESGDGDGGN